MWPFFKKEGLPLPNPVKVEFRILVPDREAGSVCYGATLPTFTLRYHIEEEKSDLTLSKSQSYGN